LWDPSYSFGEALVPGAAPTTIVQLQGAASTKVRVKRIALTLTAGTATGASTYTLNLRSTAASGGTSATKTPASSDSSQAAAGAVLKSFTAAPTAGTLTAAVGAQQMGLVLQTGAGGGTVQAIWEYSTRGDRPIVLSSASEFLTVDSSTALAAGQVLSYEIKWEEGSN